METATFDPGLTQQFGGRLRRIINKDGSFNVARRGATWRDVHPYLHIINLSWPKFMAVIVSWALGANAIFAGLYFSLGPGHLSGAEATGALGRFLDAFYFSAQTLTTVGYGVISPRGTAANMLAVVEAMLGFIGFALVTALLFGRLARPSARIGFSGNALIAAYRGGTSLQFRIVNRRVNSLLRLEARVILMTVEESGGELRRSYDVLELERDRIEFFPLTWTIVHPIGELSPLRGATAADLERLSAEVLILVSAFDDTFAQTVHARYSYRHDEIVWGARFAPAFEMSEEGAMVLHLDRVDHHVQARA